MPDSNPLADIPLSEPEDLDCVRRAQGGNRDALEQLIFRHQPWIYNIVLRMLYYPNDAEDATQEILVKLITKLSTFEGRSSFRTWLYRMAVNHVLNVKRQKWEELRPNLPRPSFPRWPRLRGVNQVTSRSDQFQVVAGGGMMRPILSIAAVLAFLAAVSYARAADDSTKNHIIALERGALERWGKGDPQGFFDIMSNEETYFDPMVGKRIDGREALRKFFAPFTGKISIERFEMVDPRVQRHGDVAILTFNLVDYGAQLDGSPKSTARWNSTEIYQRINGQWKIVHSHWSYTKPELK